MDEHSLDNGLIYPFILTQEQNFTMANFPSAMR